jgi:sugar phosphate isomerase/epimerase
MKINDISLNIYSFGYAAGFFGRTGRNCEIISLDYLIQKSKELGLGGIEFPFDRYFDIEHLSEGNNFLVELIRSKVKFFIDIENININYLNKLIPMLSLIGIKSLRVKMNQIDQTIYGGNRYLVDNFDQSIECFVDELKQLVPLIKDHEFTIAIENHQDLNSLELLRVIETISLDYIAINWDVGNSISCLDTPDSFYKNTKDFIKNVHLKDYLIYKSLDGIRLVRCPIGSGYVNYQKILPMIYENDRIESYSIELGAQITRECNINHNDYWDAYDFLPITREEYHSYVENTYSQSGKAFSPYELGLIDESLFLSEINDVDESVANLKRLIEG